MSHSCRSCSIRVAHVLFVLHLCHSRAALMSFVSQSCCTRVVCNMSARQEQHECHTSDTNATIATRLQHEWDMNNTSAKQVQQKCYTSDTTATRVLHEWHECNTSEKFWFWQRYEQKHFFTPLYLLYGKWKITRTWTISF